MSMTLFIETNLSQVNLQGADLRRVNGMVKAGLAYHYRQYSQSCPNGPEALEAGEQKARGQRLGVWAKDNVKPWDFRKAQRAG
jgi:endonuclease YncB( thermonuclease family)